MSRAAPWLRTAGKLGLLGSLYFSQGLPFGFFAQSLPVLMRKEGFALGDIGLSALLVLPWALKFLWAPLVDRHHLPSLGRRRSWILPLQVLTAAILAGLSLLPPSGGFVPLFIAFFLLNLLCATQDIATDGLAVDMLARHERGLANGLQVAGYRLGMIVGGGVLLILNERLGWRLTFLGMAALTLLATLPIAISREPTPAVDDEPPAGPRPPTVHFLLRPGAWRVLLLIITYKLGEAFGVGMLRPFLADAGLSLADIGWLIGTVGFVAGLAGAMCGGGLMNVLGRKEALISFGVVQSLAVVGFALAARGVPTKPILYAVCAAEHFTGGTATAALFTCMMDWCHPDSTATDYTVMASAVVIATGTATGLSGFSAGALGYYRHFALAALLAAVSVALAATLFPRRGQAVVIRA